MSVVHLIDTVTTWAQENVCDHIMLKVPPANEGAAVDEGYEYTKAKPTAFSMYVPTSEKLPPNILSPFPSLCVQVINGEDALEDCSGFVDIRFTFATWDPGTHGKDNFVSTSPDGSRWAVTGEDDHFLRNGDGWRDVWNFVDIARRAVSSATEIGGYVIDQSTPIKFGPMTEQEAIADLYPFWCAWLTFRMNYTIVRNIKDLSEFL